jgi:aminopeptidase YwaD
VLGINVDGVGYHKGQIAYSLYDCLPTVAALIVAVLGQYADIAAGPPWYQGDHGLFLMNQVPALAFTSAELAELVPLTHTAGDNPAIVDPGKLVTLALALRDLLLHIENSFTE